MTDETKPSIIRPIHPADFILSEWVDDARGSVAKAIPGPRVNSTGPAAYIALAVAGGVAQIEGADTMRWAGQMIGIQPKTAGDPDTVLLREESAIGDAGRAVVKAALESALEQYVSKLSS